MSETHLNDTVADALMGVVVRVNVLGVLLGKSEGGLWW
jgi:hypothetical protein